MPIAFYCRARPQQCDAFSVFREARRVFIGWPLHRGGKAGYDPQALRTCLVAPTVPEEEWQAVGGRNRNHSRNRNFVFEVEAARGSGAIVLIPRPQEGAAHLARIAGPFEIVDAPPWSKSYLRLRREQGLPADDASNCHIADVAQGWPVDEYRRIELSHVPGWLRRSMLGRATYGLLPAHPLDHEVSAYEVLDQLIVGPDAPDMEWTLEIEKIKRRLVEVLSPNAFEHLVVSLLQLEHPDEVWQHTGGPGDGGVDGFGANETGNVVGLVQAKLYARSAPAMRPFVSGGQEIRRYAAVLLPPNPEDPDDGTILLDLDWIACKVKTCWRRLPLALSIRVGNGQV